MRLDWWAKGRAPTHKPVVLVECKEYCGARARTTRDNEERKRREKAKMGKDELAKDQGTWGEEEARVWTRCEKWLARHEGFVRGAVAVRRLALGGERGVFASTPISKGVLLSSTPLSAILCPACPTLRRRPASSSTSSHDDVEDESLLDSQSAPIDPRYAPLADLLDKMSGSILAFALLVLFELTQNPTQSPWQPYLGTCWPRPPPPPLPVSYRVFMSCRVSCVVCRVLCSDDARPGGYAGVVGGARVA
jgi:hypothetical protein